MTRYSPVSEARSNRFRTLFFVSAFGIVLGTAPEPALAQSYLQKLGGLGGVPFDEPCSAGQNLAGFEVRAGDDVDAIRPVCVFTYGPTEIAAPLASGAPGAASWHGGPGGSQARMVLCPDRNPIVLGMDVYAEGEATIVVNSISLFCGRAIAGPQRLTPDPNAIFEAPFYVMKHGLFTGADPTPRSFGSNRCGSGQVAVGMHGRSGIWLDAMGLICDRPRMADRPPGSPVVVTSIGRVPSSTSAAPRVPICDAARSARERNSPAAPNLEAQCQASTAAANRTVTLPPLSTTVENPVCGTARAARARNSPAAADLEAQCAIASSQRAPAQAVTPHQAAPIPICDSARAARERKSPAAADLENQCRARGGDPRLPGGVAKVELNPQPLPPRQ